MRLAEKSLALVALMLMPIVASALEFRSISSPKAVLYDAPAITAKKLFILSQFYPVEVIVNLGGWLKVRDAQGGISWVEAKHLTSKRMVIVIVGQGEMRQSADISSNLIATLEKDVLLEVVDVKRSQGWFKVKHRDGVVGYILISSVWGFS
ncbi:MAG: hypothetical protein FJY53_06350 [Betaproteobacteria bacterium]|nr:hypothetical protein [Betaproteobacteria bacterium]